MKQFPVNIYNILKWHWNKQPLSQCHFKMVLETQVVKTIIYHGAGLLMWLKWQQ